MVKGKAWDQLVPHFQNG
uniref:Uncharacterized protein n=1 Tax=Rhizophora mucronata TaxID=61149 RepID=A0A2P2JR41_RHIMU